MAASANDMQLSKRSRMEDDVEQMSLTNRMLEEIVSGLTELRELHYSTEDCNQTYRNVIVALKENDVVLLLSNLKNALKCVKHGFWLQSNYDFMQELVQISSENYFIKSNSKMTRFISLSLLRALIQMKKSRLSRDVRSGFSEDMQGLIFRIISQNFVQYSFEFDELKPLFVNFDFAYDDYIQFTDNIFYMCGMFIEKNLLREESLPEERKFFLSKESLKRLRKFWSGFFEDYDFQQEAVHQVFEKNFSRLRAYPEVQKIILHEFLKRDESVKELRILIEDKFIKPKSMTSDMWGQLYEYVVNGKPVYYLPNSFIPVPKEVKTALLAIKRLERGENGKPIITLDSLLLRETFGALNAE